MTVEAPRSLLGPHPAGRLDAAIDAVGSVRALSVLRIALGPIVVLHLEGHLRDGLDGVVYTDRYRLPWWSWYPEATPALYLALLAGAVAAAAAMSIGLATRVGAAATTSFVAYNLFLSHTHYSHNRAFLLILLVLVTVVPTGRHLSVDALLAARRGRPIERRVPLWPLWLARFEVCVVYLASATSKVIDRDWLSGRVLRLRVVDNRALALREGAPAWALDVLADPGFQWWFAKATIATEYVIALGFLHRRTRLLAIWVAIPFHLAIQAFARVEVFSWAALAALCLWVTPGERDRTLTVGPASARFGVWARRLDWFGRFRVVGGSDALRLDDRRTPADGERGSGVTVRTGVDARLVVLSRLPATFFFAAPVLAWHRLRGRWSRSRAAAETGG